MDNEELKTRLTAMQPSLLPQQCINPDGPEAVKVIEAQAATIARLQAESDSFRRFIQNIDQEWIEFQAAEQDDWNDGYEDALCDMAKRARAELSGDNK